MTTRTKTLLIILGTLVLGIAVGVLGSGALRHKRMQRFERMMAHERFSVAMERILQPTAEQSEAIGQILTKHSEQMSAIREEHQEEIFAVFDSLRVALDSILTEEQLGRLEKNLTRGFSRRFDERIDRLTNELQLDEDQKKRIEEIMNKLEGRSRSGHKGRRGNWMERRQMARDQFKQMHEEIEAVLTAEQREKYREMQKRMRPPFERGPRRGMRHREYQH